LKPKEEVIHLLKNHCCENCKHREVDPKSINNRCLKGELCSSYQSVDDNFYLFRCDTKDSIRDFFEGTTKIIVNKSTTIEGIKAIYSPTNTLFFEQKLTDCYSLASGDTLSLNIETCFPKDLVNKVIDVL